MKLPIGKAILTIVFCCVWVGISAQSIKIYFPKFIGKPYVFVLTEGLKMDTVQFGVIGATGYVTVNLTIPEQFKGYTGIGSLSIINSGTINFIINNEDFSITCKDSIPTPENTITKDSKENELLNQYKIEMSVFYQRMDSIFKAERAVHPDSPSPSFLVAMKFMNENYSAIQKRLAADSSYAAFYIRAFNYLKGLGNRIYFKSKDEDEYLKDLTHYVTYELDFSRLFSSGLWGPLISSTFRIPDKTVWSENMVKALERTKSQRIFEALATDLIFISEQHGWDDAEKIILDYLESSGKLPEDPSNIVNRAIGQSRIKVGDKAPALIGLERVPTNSLLIFYESGCPVCQRQLDAIIKTYPQLVEKGIRVISISTDESREVYEYNSKDFPWLDRLCDFQGFKSKNVINYGVIGTPTIFFIDENDIISDRQPQFEDIKGLNIR